MYVYMHRGISYANAHFDRCTLRWSNGQNEPTNTSNENQQSHCFYVVARMWCLPLCRCVRACRHPFRLRSSFTGDIIHRFLTGGFLEAGGYVSDTAITAGGSRSVLVDQGHSMVESDKEGHFQDQYRNRSAYVASSLVRVLAIAYRWHRSAASLASFLSSLIDSDG